MKASSHLTKRNAQLVEQERTVQRAQCALSYAGSPQRCLQSLLALRAARRASQAPAPPRRCKRRLCRPLLALLAALRGVLLC
jgi:hypothetical protein